MRNDATNLRYLQLGGMGLQIGQGKKLEPFTKSKQWQGEIHQNFKRVKVNFASSVNDSVPPVGAK